MFEEENNYYIEQLYKSQDAITYLKNRKIKKSTAQFWKLGFYPLNQNNPNILSTKMKGRITIPIYNQNDELISISGRYIYKNVKNKYDHYPFPSRNTLFGLSQNKENIKEQNCIFITEGQMDVIKSWQAGLKNVVCSFGAHCSLNHIALASRYCENIYILYDADFAGQNGASKTNDFKKYGINLKILNILPSGMDLDNFFNKYSVNQFYELLEKYSDNNIKKYILEKEKNNL